MTEKDKKLINLARKAPRTAWEYIESLIPEAETEKCKKELEDMAHWAFKAEEFISFDM